MNQRSLAPKASPCFLKIRAKAVPHPESKRSTGVEPAQASQNYSALAKRQATATSWARINDRPNCQIAFRAPGRTRTGVSADQPAVGARGAESSPLNDQCNYQIGPEGLEPSPRRLRAGDAAANTLILRIENLSARRELNPPPSSYKDAALTAELRAA